MPANVPLRAWQDHISLPCERCEQPQIATATPVIIEVKLYVFIVPRVRDRVEDPAERLQRLARSAKEAIDTVGVAVDQLRTELETQEAALQNLQRRAADVEDYMQLNEEAAKAVERITERTAERRERRQVRRERTYLFIGGLLGFALHPAGAWVTHNLLHIE